MSAQNLTKSVTLAQQYTVRPATLDDAEAVTELANMVNLAKGIAFKATADIQRVDWQEPNFNLAESSLIIEDGDNIVAHACIWDNAATPVRPWCPWMLRDDLYGTGIEAYILSWIEDKAQRVLDKVPTEAKVVIQTSAFKGYDKRIQYLTNAGYYHARSFYRMLIEMDSAPPAAQFPENIIIRGMKYPDEIEAMAVAIEAGFKDHWGFVEEPLEDSVKFWTHYTGTDDLFNPEIYFLVFDTTTGQVAGLILCRMEQYGRPETAYVEELAVLPAYRRQGIALAMLYHAFGELYKRGRRQVALNVDADSLTGATRLYEKAGMNAVETWMNFQKVLRDGIDIATSSVE